MKFILTFLLAVVFSFKSFAAPTTNENKIVAVLLVFQADDDDDTQTVTKVFTTLMVAERVAQALDIQLSASTDEVDNDVFVFNLTSSEQRDLAVRLFDEEGSEVGENAFKVEKGTNLRQLNMETLQDGTYELRFSDKDGKEFNKEVIVNRRRASAN